MIKLYNAYNLHTTIQKIRAFFAMGLVRQNDKLAVIIHKNDLPYCS